MGSGFLVVGLIPHVCVGGVVVEDEGNVVNGSAQAYTVIVVLPEGVENGLALLHAINPLAAIPVKISASAIGIAVQP